METPRSLNGEQEKLLEILASTFEQGGVDDETDTSSGWFDRFKSSDDEN